MGELQVPQAHIERLAEGVALFDAGRWFEAHEAWEELWRSGDARGDLKLAYQAMILAAVALEHARRGNARGALLTSQRAEAIVGRIAPPPRLPGCDLARLLREVSHFLAPLAALGAEHWPPRRRLPVLPLEWLAVPRIRRG